MCQTIRNSVIPDPSFSLVIPASVFSGGLAAVDVTSLAVAGYDSIPKARIIGAYKDRRDWWLTGVTVLTAISRLTLRETNNNGTLLSVFPPGANHAGSKLPPDWAGLLGLQIPAGDTAPDVWVEFTAFRQLEAGDPKPCE